MFELASGEKIGEYLLKKINEKYKSVRQFGKACIEYRGETAEADEMRKMSNRLSQIIKGKKSVQLFDLPVFTMLLDVSCEELLSGGKPFARQSDRTSNYAIAFSKDEKQWLDCIN